VKMVDVVDADGRRYVIRDGRRIEIISSVPDSIPPKKTRRKAFEVEFVKVPIRWVEVLKQAKK
jgi:hypothetical protein